MSVTTTDLTFTEPNQCMPMFAEKSKQRSGKVQRLSQMSYTRPTMVGCCNQIVSHAPNAIKQMIMHSTVRKGVASQRSCHPDLISADGGQLRQPE